jgi:hypothetical protein
MQTQRHGAKPHARRCKNLKTRTSTSVIVMPIYYVFIYFYSYLSIFIHIYLFFHLSIFIRGWRAPQQMLQTYGSLEAYCATLWWRFLVSFFIFPCNGAPVERNWQRKTEVIGEKLVPVSLFPSQIPLRLTRDQTRASAVTGRRLIAWAMAWPTIHEFRYDSVSGTVSVLD